MEKQKDMVQYQLVVQTPVGRLGCRLEAGVLCAIDFIASGELCCEPEARALRDQLAAYFEGADRAFHFPLKLNGTAHQQRVWKLLQEIPPGRVRTYGEIARQIGSSAQAVGNACRNNPVPVVVPCHRVISASGIGGYAGEIDGPRLMLKRWLLNHEGVVL